jgi:PIN domain nuclease of toxin-antitoxin system
MKLLLDTHVVLWVANSPQRLPQTARDMIASLDNEVYFSVVNVWEVVLKAQLNRADFRVDARALRSGLLKAGFLELSIKSEHVFQLIHLPDLHKDPFDRMLIAQATSESMLLLTMDAQVGAYPAPIRKF